MPKISDKVALFIPTLGGGGAERVMILLANGLAEAGYEVDLIVVDSQGNHLQSVSSKVHLVDLQRPRVLTALPSLISYLRVVKPRVFISALDYANVISLIAVKLSRVATKIVITEHSTLSIASEKDFQGRSRLLPLLMKWTYPWAHQILAVSSGVANDLAIRLGLRRELISVAYNPVITKQLPELACEPVVWPWPREEGVPVILSAGRLTRAKDFSTLLKAFSILRKRRKAKLIILGEGELRSELESQIARDSLSNDVAMIGFSKNPFAWMSKVDLFVMSSAWEGLGNVLIEAMGCGTQVISTDCPSGPAEILENGLWGELVPVGNHFTLADAMDKFLESSGKDLIDVKKRAYDFTVEKSVEAYKSHIDKYF